MFAPASLDPACILHGKVPTYGFLLTAGQTISLVIFHSIYGLSQSSLGLHMIVASFGVAIGGPRDSLLVGNSVPSSDA